MSSIVYQPALRLIKYSAPTVWHEFTPLAQQHQAVNLGQGFPGWKTPDFVKQAANKAVLSEHNQYARSAGHIKLVEQLSKKYSPRLQRKIDPLNEIVVMNGSTEALCGAMLGILNPGDEVVVFEPAFDLYPAQAEMAGARTVPVPLRLREAQVTGESPWYFDVDEFKRAFNAKTKMLLLNTPHNPTGKIFTRQELVTIAEIVSQHPQVVVICDEVYEHLVYDHHQHIHFATLPDMWSRTLTISSAGKTFSITGWKVGWAIGPAALVRCVAIAHQWMVFSVHSAAQVAVAEALERAEQPYEGCDTYYDWLKQMYLKKRTALAQALDKAGIKPIMPEGSFFIIGDTSGVKLPEKYANDTTVTRDWSLCRYLTCEIGVAAIPPSAFYCDENKSLARHLARFAFCKEDDELKEAAKRLLKLKPQHKL